MVFGLFRSKKEKAIQRILDTTKDNVSRIKALDVMEDQAKVGDEEAIVTLLRAFQVTVKPDKQEQTLTPYDDEQEKWSLIDRLVGISEHRLLVVKLLRKELATPPLLPPGRRDGIVWLIELLKALAEAACDDADESDAMIRDELVKALDAYDPQETYREPGRKIELIRALGRFKTPEVRASILPYLADVDESVRFRALESLATAGDEEAGDELCRVLLDDESLRLRQRAGELLAELNCVIKGHPRRKDIESELPADAIVDKKGVVRKRSA